MGKVCYCDACGKDVAFKTITRHRKGSIKNTSFDYEETLCLCAECGNPVDYPEIGEENLALYYDAYKTAAGLLTGKEIKAIRLQFGLSAEKFALALGLGAKTITRYENGAIQTRSDDNLIRLASENNIIFRLASHAGVVVKTPKGTPAVIKTPYIRPSVKPFSESLFTECTPQNEEQNNTPWLTSPHGGKTQHEKQRSVRPV